MKRVVAKVRQHGQRYRELLHSSWKKTDLSEAAAQVILDRLDKILAAIPDAVKQAHERIIGERVVPTEEKFRAPDPLANPVELAAGTDRGKKRIRHDFSRLTGLLSS